MTLIFLLECLGEYAFELEASCAKIDQQANLRLSTLYMSARIFPLLDAIAEADGQSPAFVSNHSLSL